MGYIMQTIAKKIHAHILDAKRIAIVPHQHPDGDALGSASAFHEYLSGLGKAPVIFCATVPGKNVSFIPKADLVVTDP